MQVTARLYTPIMKAVILFPGQGAQKVGMGKDLYDSYPAAREMMEKADTALGYSLTEIMFNGPDAELTRTCNCQPALYLHGLALYEVLRSKVEKRKPRLVLMPQNALRK